MHYQIIIWNHGNRQQIFAHWELEKILEFILLIFHFKCIHQHQVASNRTYQADNLRNTIFSMIQYKNGSTSQILLFILRAGRM